MFEKPLGGTELMYNELMSRIPKEFLEHFSIFNYPNTADFNKKLIYWNQLSYDQNSVQFLKEKQNIDRIDHFVFVSNWQAEQFRKLYGIPGEKTHVMKNASIGVKQKITINTDKKIKICYTSTPWRGLDVLLKAWEILNPQNCELHIFSSCKIYGKDFASEDTKYEFLYDWCKRLPNVVYRGSIPNDQLRKELEDFDMLAYPNTFEETSCIAVIEALSAGLRVITSSIGALPETTEGWARLYSYIDNRETHALFFAKILEEEITLFRQGKLTQHLLQQSEFYGRRWHWDNRINDWINLLNSLSFNPYEIVKKHINPNSVLDIGANTGQFYKDFKKIFPNSTYHLIEANPYCEEDIKSLNVNYSISALSDKIETKDFYISNTNTKSTGNSFYKENTQFFSENKSIKLQTSLLDQLLSNKQFDLVKIDTQGSEIDIIKGGISIISNAKALIVEVSYEQYNLGSPHINSVLEFLSNIGFEKVELIQKIFHPETKQHIQDELLFINKNTSWKNMLYFK